MSDIAHYDKSYQNYTHFIFLTLFWIGVPTITRSVAINSGFFFFPFSNVPLFILWIIISGKEMTEYAVIPAQAGIHLDYGHRSMDYRIKCDNDGKWRK